jgi:hypothetical protein
MWPIQSWTTAAVRTFGTCSMVNVGRHILPCRGGAYYQYGGYNAGALGGVGVGKVALYLSQKHFACHSACK